MSAADTKERVFDYIIQQGPVTPSVREICKALDIKSTSTVFRALHALEQEKRVVLQQGKRRNIVLAGSRPSVSVPLFAPTATIGSVKTQEQVGWVTVPVSTTRPQDLFAFTLQQEGLQKDGLLFGDLLVADKGVSPLPNAVICASVNDLLVVGRYQERDNCILLGSNRAVPLDGERAAYSGVIVFSSRNYNNQYVEGDR